MKSMLAPSMMCISLDKVVSSLHIFEQTSIDYLHIDVMDGLFVPNLAYGTDYIRQLRSMTHIPLDLHLMIEHPEKKLSWFDIQPGELVSVHPESTQHLHRTLQAISDVGARPMIALNPSTPLNVLDYVLDNICGVLVMTVNPGFAGQKAVLSAIRKIADVRSYLDEHGYPQHMLEVDGNVSFDYAPLMRKNGGNLFVLGSSSALSPKVDLLDGLNRFRTLVT